MREGTVRTGLDVAHAPRPCRGAGGGPLQAWARPKDAQAEPGRTCFEDLTEEIADDLLPPLDKREVDESRLTPDQKTWRDEGCLILRGFIPPEVIDPYCRLREKLGQPGGWRTATPYMHYPEIRDLGCYGPLTDKLKELISQDMGMHLNLTGWVSTDRDWHQDDYLNPPFINSWYTAVWFALDKISADAILASACLPLLFRAVVIDGVPYWDGGYLGNPSIFPLFGKTQTEDMLLIKINPLVRHATPTSSQDIMNRLNEITFNSPLMGELRAIQFVTRLIDEGRLPRGLGHGKYRRINMHRVALEASAKQLNAGSKLNTDYDFFEMLRTNGRRAARRFLDAHFDDIGVRGTVDLQAEVSAEWA